MNKYNFVLLGSDWDLYRYSYNDIINMENVVYIPHPNKPKNLLLRLLFKIQFSRLNKIIDLPFKNLWGSRFVPKISEQDTPICFIVFFSWLRYHVDFITYLKKTYKNAKFVLFFQDLVHTVSYISGEPFNVRELQNYDLVLSFDQGDCDKYGFVYYPLVYSQCKVENINLPNSDVYFLGFAKNRLPQILSIYNKLREQNLVCDFYIVGVPMKNQVYREGIHYIQSMSYIDNVRHILHTKCILEIMQKNGKGNTQRLGESVIFDKYLLTNNDYTITKNFSNLQGLCDISKCIDSIGEIINRPLNYSKVIKDSFSPKKLLDFIEKKL